MNKETKVKIKKELYGLLRNPYLENSEIYQVMDKFLDALPESEGCPLCAKPKVLAHWQNMLKEYERFMMETENQIAKQSFDNFLICTDMFITPWMTLRDKYHDWLGLA